MIFGPLKFLGSIGMASPAFSPLDEEEPHKGKKSETATDAYIDMTPRNKDRALYAMADCSGRGHRAGTATIIDGSKPPVGDVGGDTSSTDGDISASDGRVPDGHIPDASTDGGTDSSKPRDGGIDAARRDGGPDVGVDADVDAVAGDGPHPMEAGVDAGDALPPDGALPDMGPVILDDDEDGVPNESDNCPQIVNRDQADQDLDATGDLCDDDKDGDSVLNDVDNCPNDSNRADAQGVQSDIDGDNVGDVCDPDIDGDRTPNETDNCRFVPNVDQRDTDGNGIGDACQDDLDGDGRLNADDNCPNIPNPNQEDLVHGNGIGDVCDDTVDNDGVPDSADNCVDHPNADQANLRSPNSRLGDVCDDADAGGPDGVLDIDDNCPLVFNPEQNDFNADGIGDVCQDFDGDGVGDVDDNCPGVANPINEEGVQADLDLDGQGDVCDDDIEGDGVANVRDNCPTVFNADQANLLSPGSPLGDVCDDPDADGIIDVNDNCPLVANVGQEPGGPEANGEACTPRCDLAAGQDPRIGIPENGIANFSFLVRGAESFVCDAGEDLSNFQNPGAPAIVSIERAPDATTTYHCTVSGFGIDSVACPSVEVFVNQAPQILSLDAPVNGALGVLPTGNQTFIAENTISVGWTTSETANLTCHVEVYNPSNRADVIAEQDAPRQDGPSLVANFGAHLFSPRTDYCWQVTSCIDSLGQRTASVAEHCFTTSDKGLLMWLRFQDAQNLGFDSSGNGNDAEVLGGEWVNESGGALLFNDAVDQLIWEYSDDLNPRYAMTYEALFSLNNDSALSNISIWRGIGGLGWDLGIDPTNPAGHFFCSMYTADDEAGQMNHRQGIATSPEVVRTETPYHVACVYDGAALIHYMSGQVDDQVNLDGVIATTAANRMSFGSGPQIFSGKLYELALYNRALDPQEIGAICEANDPSGDRCQ